MIVGVHPIDPEPRKIERLVEMLKAGGVLVCPTDTVYAFVCSAHQARAIEHVAWLKGVKPQKAELSLICGDLSQLSTYARAVDTAAFRLMKRALPGPYTFILPATKDVPRRLLHPKKLTVGVRIPGVPVVRALLEELGEPLVSSTLLLPGEEQPMTQGWEIKETLDHAVDAVVDAGECGTEPTTVIDLSGSEPEVLRVGGGDPSRFE